MREYLEFPARYFLVVHLKERAVIDSIKKSYLRLGIEIAGMASIAASLIFVGVQLRQDRLIAQAELYQGRTEITSENFRMLLEDHDVIEIRIKARSGGDLTDVEKEVLDIALSLPHLAYQNIHFQHRLGLIDDAWWLVTRQNLKRDMQRLPGFRESVRLTSPDYIELINELAEEISSIAVE